MKRPDKLIRHQTSPHHEFKPLTNKEELIVEYFLQSNNKTESYLRGFNCTRSTAHGEGKKFFDRPHIKYYVDNYYQKILGDQQALMEAMIAECVKLAFHNPLDFGEWLTEEFPNPADTSGNSTIVKKISTFLLTPSDKLTRSQGAAIQEIRNTKQGVKIKFYDKIKALDQLAKLIGVYKFTIDHMSSDGSMTPRADVLISNTDIAGFKNNFEEEF